MSFNWTIQFPASAHVLFWWIVARSVQSSGNIARETAQGRRHGWCRRPRSSPWDCAPHNVVRSGRWWSLASTRRRLGKSLPHIRPRPLPQIILPPVSQELRYSPSTHHPVTKAPPDSLAPSDIPPYLVHISTTRSPSRRLPRQKIRSYSSSRLRFVRFSAI